MPTDPPQIVVVIVNWQRAEDTLACLQSIYSAGIDNLACLVVDNGSQDSSIEEITAAFPQVDILALPQNLGFAGGYNAGIHRALETGAPKIFLLNNDTVVDASAIPALANAAWDVAVPKIVYHQQPDRVWCAGCAWRPFPPSVIMLGFGKPAAEPRLNQAYSLEYATGCALMVNRQVFESAGGFDEAFISYMEDYDFSYRLRHHGFQMGYVPEAVVQHKISQSLGEFTPRRWKLMGRSSVLFYRKNQRFPLWKLLIFLTWVCLREAFKGNLQIIPAFLTGARQGFASLRQMRSSQSAERPAP